MAYTFRELYEYLNDHLEKTTKEYRDDGECIGESHNGHNLVLYEIRRFWAKDRYEDTDGEHEASGDMRHISHITLVKEIFSEDVCEWYADLLNRQIVLEINGGICIPHEFKNYVQMAKYIHDTHPDELCGDMYFYHEDIYLQNDR